MKKMTKLAVTVAAMSAMTIAAATMVSADGKYNSIANEKPATGISDGKWGGNNTDGWTFTVDDKKVIGWNQIDGVWYYFHKDTIMAREELVYLNGHTYYFNSDGSMMANGWVGFDQDSNILYDYNLDVQDNIDDINNPVYTKPEDTYDTVWMFFNSNGQAKDDEWFHADSGLWYYFDDIIMVAGDFDHEIGNSHYGFDENGAMLVGWAENYNDHYLKAPNKDERTWYYYNSDGKKFDASDNNNDSDFAWKKIDGKWYCFYGESNRIINNDSTINDGEYYSVGTLIVNTFFSNQLAAGQNKYKDYYYVDKKGEMVTGVVTVDKDAQFVGTVDGVNYTFADDRDFGQQTKDDKSWDVFFNNNGAAQDNKWSGDRFYAGIDTRWVYKYDDGSNIYSVTGYTDLAQKIKGALVKESFVNDEDNDNTYFVDKYGDKVTSSGVQIGYVEVTRNLDSKGRELDTYNIINFSDQDFVATELAAVDPVSGKKTTTDGVVYRAYVVLDGKGVAYDDVDEDRTVSAGSKKYISTGYEFMEVPGFTNNTGSNTITKGVPDATVFFYKNKN